MTIPEREDECCEKVIGMMEGRTFEAVCSCEMEYVWFKGKDKVPENPKCKVCGAELERIHPAKFILDNPLVDARTEQHREVLEEMVEEL